MTTPADVIRVATAYWSRNITEIPLGSNNAPGFTDWYGIGPARWCAIFISRCFYDAGMPLEIESKKGFASCDNGAKYFKKLNRYDTTPQVGDIVFYDFKTGNHDFFEHVGILVSFTATTVTTIDGNTSCRDSQAVNGGGVRKCTRSRSNVNGYGHPAYSGTSSGTTTGLDGCVTVTDPSVTAAPATGPITASRYSTSNELVARRRRAFLDMISDAEGTSKYPNQGYNTIFGGQQFTSFSRHPNIDVPYKNTSSDAAGRYQFLKSTWDGVAQRLGLTDFSPTSQDKAIIDKMRTRGALDSIDAGNIRDAIYAARKEFASFPGAGYGQPEKTYEYMLASYAKHFSTAPIAGPPAPAGTPAPAATGATTSARLVKPRVLLAETRFANQLVDPRVIVIHTTESAGTAQSTANYFRNENDNVHTASHYIVDETEVVQSAYETDVVRHAGLGSASKNDWRHGGNPFSIGIEHIGYARFTKSDWASSTNTKMLDLSARLSADICATHGIQPVHLTPEQVRNGGNGFAGHSDITLAFPKDTTGHTDPGANFPWDAYLSNVKKYLGNRGAVTTAGAPTAVELCDPLTDYLGGAPSLPPTLSRPLYLTFPYLAGQDVLNVQALVGAVPTGTYGIETRFRVYQWQVRNKVLANGIFGLDSALKAGWTIVRSNG